MPWVTTVEWANIDLLAVECWQQARVVGYEVKISRGDYRAELLDPTKRAEAVSRTTQFYFATPAGMLKPEEIAFEEPDWTFEDFEHQRCTHPQCKLRYHQRGWAKQPRPRGSTLRGTSREGQTISFGHGTDRGKHPDGATYSHSYSMDACCLVCRGYGKASKSRVELESPVVLWVPKDVGLVEVHSRDTRIVKPAPVRKTPRTILGETIADEHKNKLARYGIAQLMRWASVRPDPRHH